MGRRGGGRFGNRPSKPQPDPADTPPRRLRLPYRRLLPGSLPITQPPHRPLRPRPLHPRTRPPPRRKPQHPNPFTPPHRHLPRVFPEHPAEGGATTGVVTVEDAHAAVAAAALPPMDVAALFERLLNRTVPSRDPGTDPAAGEHNQLPPPEQPLNATAHPPTPTSRPVGEQYL